MPKPRFSVELRAALRRKRSVPLERRCGSRPESLKLVCAQTAHQALAASGLFKVGGSGWLCYPGKLKLVEGDGGFGFGERGSGWLCYPGKLKPGAQGPEAAELQGSGWLCYPGKLKHGREAEGNDLQLEFRMALLSGEVETRHESWRTESGTRRFRMALLSGEVETTATTPAPGSGG